jgi:hypothetical protein
MSYLMMADEQNEIYLGNGTANTVTLVWNIQNLTNPFIEYTFTSTQTVIGLY